ncbi:MAG: hypothetical protein ABJF88_18040 [Rhodothermales bacterium]
MQPLRRHPGLYLLLAILVAAGSVAAAGQQGATRGTTATALQPAMSSVSGSVFATPLNVVALANTLGWQEAPLPTGAAEFGERPLSGPSPSEWAAGGQGAGEAARRATRPATLGSVHAFGPDRTTPELCRLCVYRL